MVAAGVETGGRRKKTGWSQQDDLSKRIIFGEQHGFQKMIRLEISKKLGRKSNPRQWTNLGEVPTDSRDDPYEGFLDKAHCGTGVQENVINRAITDQKSGVIISTKTETKTDQKFKFKISTAKFIFKLEFKYALALFAFIRVVSVSESRQRKVHILLLCVIQRKVISLRSSPCPSLRSFLELFFIFNSLLLSFFYK